MASKTAQSGGTDGLQEEVNGSWFDPSEGKITLTFSREGMNDYDGPRFVREFNERVVDDLLREGFAEHELRYDASGMVVCPSVSRRMIRSLATEQRRAGSKSR